MKEVFKQIIFEYQEFIPAVQVQKRDVVLEQHGNYVFVGSRRVGKSYFMYQVIQELLQNGTSIENVLFINFEDERLMELQTADLNQIMEAYKELFGYQPICFFDEIQNIAGWEKFVRRLADRNYQVYVTGSNAQMLSREMATVLGGRFFIKEIYPLSFTEFLTFNELRLQPAYEYKEQRFDIQRLFEQYFYHGAFPETLQFEHKKEYLSNLYQKVFYGDVIARYGVKNDYALKLLMKKIAESTTDETSFNRLKNLIKSTGASVGTATLIEYFAYLEDSFLAFSLLNYSAKFSERESKKKFYFNDNGILGLFLLQPEAQLTETLVFNYLHRKYGDALYYYRDGFEVDFYIPHKKLVQVAYRLEQPETRKRELGSLVKAAKETGLDALEIVTYANEETIEHLGYSIQVVPLWKWCLKLDAEAAS